MEMNDDLRQLSVVSVNTKRQLHQNTPDVTYDMKLEAQAIKWAKHLAETQKFYHSGCKYGENLAMMGTSSSLSIENAIKRAVDMWYNEIKMYNYSNPRFAMHTGHFTQLIWKATTKIGVGVSSYVKTRVVNGREFKMTSYIVVMNYSVFGNVSGLFQRNVLPLKSPNPRSIIPMIIQSEEEANIECIEMRVIPDEAEAEVEA